MNATTPCPCIAAYADVSKPAPNPSDGCLGLAATDVLAGVLGDDHVRVLPVACAAMVRPPTSCLHCCMFMYRLLLLVRVQAVDTCRQLQGPSLPGDPNRHPGLARAAPVPGQLHSASQLAHWHAPCERPCQSPGPMIQHQPGCAGSNLGVRGPAGTCHIHWSP